MLHGTLPAQSAPTVSPVTAPKVSSSAPQSGNRAGLPEYVVFGEALTDMLLQGARQWHAVPGGSCWNVARTAARLGVPTAFAGCISRDVFGDDLLFESERAGLDLRFLQRAAAPPLLAIVPSLDPPRYFFIGEGTADLQFDPDALPGGWQDAVKMVHFGGISLARQPLAGSLVNEAEALHARGVHIAFDPNFRDVMRTPDYQATFRRLAPLSRSIKVSEEDLEGLFPEGTIASRIAALSRLSPKATLLLTRGARGMSLFEKGQVLEQAAYATNVIDTVGCGDAAMGGWVAALLNKPALDAPSQLRMAAASAAITASRSGPYAASKEELQILLG